MHLLESTPEVARVWSAQLNDVAAEVAARGAQMRAAAARTGVYLYPPLLMLGTSERVGSNWFSDTLRVVMQQHNEPFRQQISAGHPLSPMNLDVPDAGPLTPFARHWLTHLVLSKLSPQRQCWKETNLWFGLPSLMALLPDSPVAVLTRSPLGVASSFARGRLFTRWHYRERYAQLRETTMRPRWRDFSVMLPDDDPDDLTALVRMHALNTVLTAWSTNGRTLTLVPYELSIVHRPRVMQDLAATLPDLGFALASLPVPTNSPRPGTEPGPREASNDFDTSHTKSELVAHLSSSEAERVRATTAQCMAVAGQVVEAPIAARACDWLAGDHLYTLASAPRPASTPTPEPMRRAPQRTVQATYVPEGVLAWRSLLITNAEMAKLLNDLAEAGVANTLGGAHLIVCPMPEERGGRLHQDPASGRWHVSTNYEEHPAYWVTWIGAALLAARHGARLPTFAELRQQSAGHEATHADYRLGDVVPVAEPGRGPAHVHHLVGNVQVWCADGPTPEDLGGGPASRWFHGAAWNTPSTPAEIHRHRHRHITGSSRGIGVRLVRDPDATGEPASLDRLVEVLQEWLTALTDRSVALVILDQPIVADLAALTSAPR